MPEIPHRYTLLAWMRGDTTVYTLETQGEAPTHRVREGGTVSGYRLILPSGRQTLTLYVVDNCEAERWARDFLGPTGREHIRTTPLGNATCFEVDCDLEWNPLPAPFDPDWVS